MDDGKIYARQLLREFDRLGLKQTENPRNALAGTSEALQQLLAKLREMQPGVTWRDVHPDIPAEWDLKDRSTWIEPFKPLGDFDYQQLPAGTAFLLRWSEPNARDRHNALVEFALSEGWPIYSGALKEQNGEGYKMNIGYIVLKLGVDEDTTWAVQEWLLAQPGVQHSLRYRSEREETADD